MCLYNKYSYKFHFFNSNGITLLVFCDAAYDDKLAFDFLEKINRLFIDKFSKEQFFEIYNARLNDSSYLIDSPEFVHYKRVADTILRKRNTLWDKSLSGA